MARRDSEEIGEAWTSSGVGGRDSGTPRQSRFEFLDRLGQELTKLTDADEIMATITRLTAEHLDLSNCAYADMDADEDGFTIRGNWHAPGSPSIVGHYSLADFGRLAVRELGAGRPLVINDNLKDIAPEEAKRFQGMGIGATICVPLVSGGRLRALMAIHDNGPHYWTDYEQQVIREVTDRSWAHIERVRAEAELRASNDRFRAAVKATRGVLWTNDADGRMVGTQSGWSALTGQTTEEYQGYGWTSAVHPDDAQATLDAWQEAVRQQRTFIFEHRVRRFDGVWRLCAIRAVPVTDNGGAIVEWVGVHTDVTEDRAAEETLREESRILETLNKTGSALAAELNLESLVQTVTDAGVELTGAQFGAFFYNVLNDGGESYMLYTLSGAPRSAFEDFGMPRATAVFQPTFKGEGVIRSDDILADPRYGKSLPHRGMPKGHLPVRSYLAVPVTSRSGEVIGGLLFGHERPAVFTARHEKLITGIAGQAAVAIDNARLFETTQRLNETLEARVIERTAELEQAQEALRQAQKMEAVGQLTGGIAHDFNNLLTGVIGSLDMMQRRMAKGEMDKIERYATTAMTAANRAAALTHRLLAFARRQPLDPKPVNANRMVTGMEELLRRTIGESVQLEIVTAGGLWQTLCDPHQLESAILNLAINARDAMPDGGKLTIETCNAGLDKAYAAKQRGVAPGQYICICVTDTGTGMTKDTIEKAFEPFFTTKPTGQGTGLGLSMIYGFTRQSEGYARIYSEVGEGTTIKLYLPRYYGEAEDAEQSQGELTDAHRAEAGEVVLVVEDETAVRDLVVEVLGELGYRAIEAVDGPSGLKLLQSKMRLDLLVTDIGLPGLNGRQLADAAREHRPGLKVLFMTGYAENATIANGFLEPGMQMITKPFAIEALVSRIRDMIEKK